MNEMECSGLIVDRVLQQSSHTLMYTKNCHNLTFLSTFAYIQILTVEQRLIIIKRYILSNNQYLHVIWGNAKKRFMNNNYHIVNR